MKLTILVLSLLGVVSGEVIHLNSDQSFGTITSPGFPGPYPPDLDITSVVTADPGFQVKLYFTIFDIEDSFDLVPCAYDFLRIENKNGNQTFCGNEEQYPLDSVTSQEHFISKDNVMTIQFVSDFSNGDFAVTGFEAHYSFVDKDECYEQQELVRNTVEDWDQLVYCNQHCVNVPGSYYCACRVGFFLQKDEHTCSPICSNKILTEDSGVISTSEYPKDYGRLANCDWTIEVRDGLSLNLIFDSNFEIETHFEYSQPDCVYDSLKLSYGDVKNTYCGNTAPNNGQLMELNTRRAKLEFITDSSVEMKGFSVRYTTTKSRCLEQHVAPSNGEILSQNQKGFYELDDVIEFQCNTGYEFNVFDDDVKVVRLTCQSDGSWDDVSPTCKIKSCGSPNELRNVANSKIIGYENLAFTYNEVFTIECNQWYEQRGGTLDWICTDDKQWEPILRVAGDQVPTCKPECGDKNFKENTLGSHISGGREGKQFEYPWLVGISRGNPARIAEIDCAGSLISEEYVLTAAHCVVEPVNSNISISPNRLHAWLNAHEITRERFFPGRSREVGVADVIVHDDYNPRLKNNDIALIRLSQTIVMDNITRPICVPGVGADFDRLSIPLSSGLVAGWGKTGSNTGKVTLLEANFPTVTSAICWQNFQDIARNENLNLAEGLAITNNMFCAGDPTGGGSTCQGDSGGPFMMANNDVDNPVYYVHGIVSFGLDAGICGRRESYSVFSKVHQEYSRWIRERSDLE